MTGPALHSCPVCRGTLETAGDPWQTEELFAMWHQIGFSRQTVEQHLRQSASTRRYACPQCRLEIFLPQVIGTPDFYRELQGEPESPYYVDEKWDFATALEDAARVEKIVEIGCGPGAFLDRARHRVALACGVEYNEQAQAAARSKGLQVFMVDDPELAGLKGQFDIAYSFHVLEHVADPVGFVRELFTWVKPGGRVGISVPDMDGPVKYLDPCVSNMPPHHATRWTLQTFQALADRLGLSIERVAHEPLAARDHYYYSHYAVNAWFPGRFFPRRLLHAAARLAFELGFRVLSLFGRKHLGLFRGQSIYLLLAKKADG